MPQWKILKRSKCFFLSDLLIYIAHLYNKSSYKGHELFMFDKNKKNAKSRGIESMYVEGIK